MDLYSVRRRAAPLCRGRVRRHPDQGDLLGVVARVWVRDGSARRQLPQRPLQDGGAVGAAGPRPLPPPRGTALTAWDTSSSWTPTCARDTRCARWRRPTTSRCPNAGPSRFLIPAPRRRCENRSKTRWTPAHAGHCPSARSPTSNYTTREKRCAHTVYRSPARTRPLPPLTPPHWRCTIDSCCLYGIRCLAWRDN